MNWRGFGGPKAIKLYVFEWEPSNLKPDSEPASKSGPYATRVMSMGAPWTAWCIERAVPEGTRVPNVFRAYIGAKPLHGGDGTMRRGGPVTLGSEVCESRGEVAAGELERIWGPQNHKNCTFLNWNHSI